MCALYAGGNGGVGSVCWTCWTCGCDALCAAPYAGDCEGRALFAGRADAMRCMLVCMLEVIRCVLLCMLEAMVGRLYLSDVYRR